LDTDGGTQAIAFSVKDYGGDSGDISPTLRAMGHAKSHQNGGGQVGVASFDPTQITSKGNRSTVDPENPAGTLHGDAIQAIIGTAVRRLMPSECEKLQGFPPGFTRIVMRKYKVRKITELRPVDLWEETDGGWNLMAADGPRYKAIGNSMATTCMSWIGKRIEFVTERFCSVDTSQMKT